MANDVRWRELSGAGDHTAPPFEQSRSAGDLQRNSYRQSQYPRLATLAVTNDDGTPIVAPLEDLLRELMRLTAQLLDRIQGPVYDNTNPLPTRLVEDRTIFPFTTEEIMIPGIVPGAAYAAGDALGTKFSFAVPVTGTIANAIFLDRDDEGLAKELVLFRRDFAQTADNAIFDINDADLETCVGVVPITQFFNFNSNQIGQGTPALSYTAPEGRLWGQIVTRGADNIAAGQLPSFYLVILP